MQSDSFFDLRLDGAEKTLWEPLWRLSTELSPLEQALLATFPLRRLHFLAHNGSSAILTGHNASRLQHTLGVFSLIAHFQPDKPLLRAAALLHDIGHYPFSHTLEHLPGVDHHAATRARLLVPPIASVLETYNIEPGAVISLIMGEVQSPLRNNEGILQADHLDSWVRGAQARGQLSSGADLLKNLWMTEPHLETDSATAERLVELIVAEAHFHLSAANLGSSTVLEHLTSALLEAEVITLDALSSMTDAELGFHLLSTPQTRTEAESFGLGLSAWPWHAWQREKRASSLAKTNFTCHCLR